MTGPRPHLKRPGPSRKVDICKICLPDGGAIPGEYWTTIFDSYTDSIKSFCVHQAKDYSITINYEPFPGVNCDHIIQAVNGKLSKRVGSHIPLTFRLGNVDVNDNGKTRFVVSEIKS